MDTMSTNAADTPHPILDNETRVSDELICGICFSVPYDRPVITPCEHIFCGECLEQAMKRNKCCPNDRCPISTTDVKPLEKGKLLWRIWANILVRCGNCEVGCRWKGSIAEYKGHAENCPGVILADKSRIVMVKEFTNVRKELHLLAMQYKQLRKEKDAECTKLKNEYRLLATQLKEEKNKLKKWKNERRQLVEESPKLKKENNSLKESLSQVTSARTRD
ncbi:hypothetical protein ACHAW6_005011 [Cyclotella cf. meneghiniana]